MALLAGSYERFIWGFSCRAEASTLKSLFSYPSHLAPIKSVAVSGPVAASGASDDTIKIYDLSSRSEIGSLTDHTGAVTTLSFYTHPSLSFPRNLISGSDDGSVAIYDVDPFIHLKSITAHKRGVNDLSIHPSGKLALSIGKDSCLAMLNLVRGKKSFSCRLEKEASSIMFDNDGEHFFMITDEVVTMHHAQDARIRCDMKCQKRVLCAAPSKSSILFTGGEDRYITAWDTMTGKAAFCIKDAHAARLKGLVLLGCNEAGDGQESYMIASASSDGVIRVWDLRSGSKDKQKPLAEVNTMARLTCLAGSSLKSTKKQILSGDVLEGGDDVQMEVL